MPTVMRRINWLIPLFYTEKYDAPPPLTYSDLNINIAGTGRGLPAHAN